MLAVVVPLPPDVVPGTTVPPPAHLQDFAFVFNYARRALATPGESPYTAEAHREFFRAWFGPDLRSALCFPYGPMSILLLAPLFALPARWAWLVWNLAGAWLFSSAVGVGARGRAGAGRLGRLVGASLNGFHCLVLGQTGLVTTGLFALALDRADDVASRRGAWIVAACVAALTTKPSFALVAATALLAAGRVRPVLLALVPIGASVAFAEWWWTPGVLMDYAALLARYNLVDGDEIVRAGCTPELMSTLRGMLLRSGWLDDAQAFRVAGAVTVAALAAPVASAVLSRRRWSLDLAASWAVMAYLVLSPHLSSTEDLLLLVPLGCLLRTPGIAGWARAAVVVGCLVPQFVGGGTVQLGRLLVPDLTIATAAPVVGFVVKLLPAWVVVTAAFRERRGATARA